MRKTILLMACLTCLSVGSVQADTFGRGSKADDKVHIGCWVPNPRIGSISPGLSAAFQYINKFTPVSVRWNSSCARGTDMHLDDRLSNRNLFGVRSCKSGVVNGVCDESRVKINRNKINSAVARSRQSQAQAVVWCHEIGHSLGLPHSSRGGTCMRIGELSDLFYKSHHRNHLHSGL